MPQFNLGQRWANIGKTVGDIAQMKKSAAERKRAERFQGQQMLQNTLKDVTGYFTGLEKEKTRQRERQENIDREQEQFEWEKFIDARDFADKQWQRKVEQGEANLDRYIAERNRKEVMELENRKMELLETKAENEQQAAENAQEKFDLEKQILKFQVETLGLKEEQERDALQAGNREAAYNFVFDIAKEKMYTEESIPNIADGIRLYLKEQNMFDTPEETAAFIDKMAIEDWLRGSLLKDRETLIEEQARFTAITASIGTQFYSDEYQYQFWYTDDQGVEVFNEEAASAALANMVSAYEDDPAMFDRLTKYFFGAGRVYYPNQDLTNIDKEKEEVIDKDIPVATGVNLDGGVVPNVPYGELSLGEEVDPTTTPVFGTDAETEAFLKSIGLPTTKPRGDTLEGEEVPTITTPGEEKSKYPQNIFSPGAIREGIDVSDTMLGRYDAGKVADENRAFIQELTKNLRKETEIDWGDPADIQRNASPEQLASFIDEQLTKVNYNSLNTLNQKRYDRVKKAVNNVREIPGPEGIGPVDPVMGFVINNKEYSIKSIMDMLERLMNSSV